ncbi:MAG: cardiolipin synthase [Deltaproteobacteria bacterium]|nr:cardiolipin synthase [Deltaproteobacteria bacterium]
MGKALWIFLVLHVLVALALSADLLFRRKEPVATLAWLEGLLFIPVLGALLYVVFGAETIQRRKYRKRTQVIRAFEGSLRGHVICCPAGDLPPQAAEALKIAISCSRRPPTLGNALRLFPNVSALYDDLERAIGEARRHIHFQFYILQPDETGRRFIHLLAAKAAAGVEVRLLLDAVGSRRLRAADLGELIQAGGSVGWFLPIRLAPPPFPAHLRNHRKIAILDGTVGFIGGANIGDEYRGRWARKSSWHDTHVRLEGPAVHHLQEVFVEDWRFATGRSLLREDYFPPQKRVGDAIVHVIPSGPDDPTRALSATLFHAIVTARERVWIATPYFIPDAATLAALTGSARRGVDVRLLLPERSDHPLVDRAGESFLPELLEAGVKVFRYEAGMLHSKLVIVDGQWGVVGSANMDIRSFRLDFEVSLAVLSESWAHRLEEVFQAELFQSHQYTRSHAAAAPLVRRLTIAACRTLAPIL